MHNINKTDLIQLFSFPRQRILQSMEVTHCPHAVFDQLKQQLLIAVDYIDSNLSPHHMSRRKCQCENCRWLRQVQMTLDGKA